MEKALQAKGIFKAFGSTKALTDANLQLEKGEIHGLIGENGSGKSTLASIAAGIQQKDAGEMLRLGTSYEPHSIFDAIARGIAMIGQEQNTFDETNVAENIFLGKEEKFIVNGFVSQKRMNAAAREILGRLELTNIDEKEMVGKLNFEERKLVELAKAMYDRPQILIIDETSTTLGKYGRELLYQVMYGMRKEENAVLFISHDVEEIMHMCDRVTILRDGRVIATIEKRDYDSGEIKRLMVGREIADDYYRTDYGESCADKVALEAKNICSNMLYDVSLAVSYGEILGIGGLTDCGMHNLGKVLFGLEKPEKGTVITSDGCEIRNPTIAHGKKIAYISKNRDKEALMLSSSIKDNICLPSYGDMKKKFLIFPRDEKEFAGKWAQALLVKMRDINQNVRYLSGGNKQKVAVAKWLGTDADIYIFDCPTRGIDVGVQSDIYDLLDGLRIKGKAILMISEELPELIGMSDRIIILKNGKISGEFNRDKSLDESQLIHYII